LKGKILAEREGFYYRHFQQLVVNPTDSDFSQSLCGWQANSSSAAVSLVSLIHLNSAENGITGITLPETVFIPTPRRLQSQ
jgi:hypothetical protein